MSDVVLVYLREHRGACLHIIQPHLQQSARVGSSAASSRSLAVRRAPCMLPHAIVICVKGQAALQLIRKRLMACGL